MTLETTRQVCERVQILRFTDNRDSVLSSLAEAIKLYFPS